MHVDSIIKLNSDIYKDKVVRFINVCEKLVKLCWISVFVFSIIIILYS